MDWMSTWLVSITSAAILAALADALAPQGTPRRILRLACGLLLLLAVLGPVKKLEAADLTEIIEKYQGEYFGYEETLARQSEDMTKGIIEERAGAYILDKATGLGLKGCSVSVSCRTAEGEEFPVPWRVTVRGRGDEEAWRALREAITSDFAIEVENQTFERVDAP